jgi:hypothetical protein
MLQNGPAIARVTSKMTIPSRGPQLIRLFLFQKSSRFGDGEADRANRARSSLLRRKSLFGAECAKDSPPFSSLVPAAPLGPA